MTWALRFGGVRRAAWGLLVLMLVLTACSTATNWPEVACSPDLAEGTTCVPGEDQRALELFEGVESEADAAALRMTDPVAAAISTNCTSMSTIFTVCVSSEAGITVITPVVMPEDGRISFAGSGFETIDSVRLDGPLGLRRSAGDFTLVIEDKDSTQVGSIPLGFYP